MSEVPLVDTYRAQIGRLLELAHETLGEVELDALRWAIRRNRAEGVAPGQSVPGLLPRALNIADRLIAQLHDADRELSPGEVADLETLIQDRLDVGL